MGTSLMSCNPGEVGGDKILYSQQTWVQGIPYDTTSFPTRQLNHPPSSNLFIYQARESCLVGWVGLGWVGLDYRLGKYPSRKCMNMNMNMNMNIYDV